jgi:hypothetical protein
MLTLDNVSSVVVTDAQLMVHVVAVKFLVIVCTCTVTKFSLFLLKVF